jgi:hypothetical protein
MKQLTCIASIMFVTVGIAMSQPHKEDWMSPPRSHPGVVKSVNGLSGQVTISAGTNVTVTRVGNGLRISASASGGGDRSQDWSRRGNVAAPGEFLGTLNDAPLEMIVNGQRALRLEATENTPNVIGGFFGNQAIGAVGATIGGGGTSADLLFGVFKPNEVHSAYGTVGGGLGNRIGAFSGIASTISGGDSNWIAGQWAAIGGGHGNRIEANACYAAIGGGYGNNIEQHSGQSTIGGGLFNTISMFSGDAVVGGGRENAIGSNALGSVIAGGVGNHVEEAAVWSTIGGGLANLIASNAFGAAIPGGYANLVGGRYSLAAGQRAVAFHDGSFVWSDGTPGLAFTTTSNQFIVRASGGTKFFTSADLASGVELPKGGGSWLTLSDQNLKENFRQMDKRDILDRVTKLPIQTWNMKTQDPSIRHIGPTAQAFHAAFGLGEDDRHINTVDADGVALAAIQGLHQLVQERDARISRLEKRIERLEEMLRSLPQVQAETSGTAP